MLVLLALMAFAGEAPVCTSGLMPCIPIGLPPLRFDLLTHHTSFLRALLQNDFLAFDVLSSLWWSQAAARSTGFHFTWSKALPLTRTAQTVRASLLASAATTTLYGRRSNSLSIQPLR